MQYHIQYHIPYIFVFALHKNASRELLKSGFSNESRVPKNKNPSIEASQHSKLYLPWSLWQYHLLSDTDGHFLRSGGDIGIGYYVFYTVYFKKSLWSGLRATKNAYWGFQNFLEWNQKWYYFYVVWNMNY